MKNLLTIHSTQTGGRVEMTAKQIDRRDRQWGLAKIGYHYVIRRDGTVEHGRPLTEASIHDEPHVAKSAVGIALVGGADEDGGPEDNFLPDQITALTALLRQLRDKLGQVRINSVTPAIDTDRVVRLLVRPEL